MSGYIVWEEGDDPTEEGIEVETWDPEDAAEIVAELRWESFEPWSEKDFMVKDTETGTVEEFTVSVSWDPTFTARKKRPSP